MVTIGSSFAGTLRHPKRPGNPFFPHRSLLTRRSLAGRSITASPDRFAALSTEALILPLRQARPRAGSARGTIKQSRVNPVDNRARCGTRERASDMRPRGPRTKAAQSASFAQPACRRALALAGDSLASVVPCQATISAASRREPSDSRRRRPESGCGSERRSAPPSSDALVKTRLDGRTPS